MCVDRKEGSQLRPATAGYRLATHCINPVLKSTGDPVVAGSIPAGSGNILPWTMIMTFIFSTVILSLPLIEGQLLVSGEIYVGITRSCQGGDSTYQSRGGFRSRSRGSSLTQNFIFLGSG